MVELANIQNLFKGKQQDTAQKQVSHNITLMCPKCKTEMKPKGSVEDASEAGTVIVFQCPECKNVEMRWKECDSEFRMTYP